MARVFPKVVLALAGLCLVAPAPGSLSAQTIGLTLGDGTRASVSSGAKLTVPLNVDLANAGGTTLGALQAGVTWGVGKLRLDSVRVAAGSGFALTTNTTNVAGGQLLFNAYNPTGLAASGALVNLYFTGGTTAGGTSIELTPTAAGNTAGESIASQLTTKGLDVCVAGSTWSTASARWGDANGNGAVNVTDAQQLARYAVALSVTNLLAAEERGDVNTDAVVDVLDALLVARFSAGLSAGTRVNTVMVVASDLPAVATVEVSPGSIVVGVAEKRTLVVTPRAADGVSLAGCYQPTWVSSSTARATVSSNGLVTGKAVGSATISVTAGGKTAAATVLVDRISAAGLLAYHPADGNANDISGNGRDGVLQGATTVANRFGVAGRAVFFDGVPNGVPPAVAAGGLATMDHLLSLGAASYSISLWFRMGNLDIWNSGSEGSYTLMGGSPNNSLALAFHATRPGRSTLWIGDAISYWNSPAVLGTITTWQAARWYHAVIRKNGTEYTVWVDGQPEATITIAAAASYTESIRLTFGAASFTGPFEMINGAIDDIRIYSRALTDAEAATLSADRPTP